MRYRRVLVAVIGVAVLGAGCTTNQPASSANRTQGRTLRVVATTTQVADFAANVGGDLAMESSGFHGPVVDASQGVRLRMVGGQPDPHIWQNPRDSMVMVAISSAPWRPRTRPTPVCSGPT